MSNQPVNQAERDDALFESMAADRKKRRHRIIRTTIISAIVLAVVGTLAVTTMRRNVSAKFDRSRTEVKAYAASIGTVSTTVSGTGVISDVDTENINVPAGVEIDEVKVDAGDNVLTGDVLATVKRASVLSAISDVQKELDTIDNDITATEHDFVNMYISTGVSGRVKRLIAQSGDEVLECMTKNGALAVMSIDGCMAFEIESDSLTFGDTVKVSTCGSSYHGTVVNIDKGIAKITITDDGPLYDAEAEAFDGAGNSLGVGRLYINSPISLTGYAGRIARTAVQENAFLYAGHAVYVLTDNLSSAAHDAHIEKRRDKEAELADLMKILGDDAVCAPFDGTVSTIEYNDTKPAAGVVSAYKSANSSGKTKLVTMSPNREVSVNIPVDETNILSLKIGQEADVTVSSFDDEIFPGRVTEINKVADSSSGVTQYSAVVTFEKSANMLQGMSATADIKIEGVENAVIIPVDALHKTSSRHYVYTEYDAETKEYGGMKDVEAGVSNANYVEIVSGLEEGETVYYVEKQKNNFMLMMSGGARR